MGRMDADFTRLSPAPRVPMETSAAVTTARGEALLPRRQKWVTNAVRISWCAGAILLLARQNSVAAVQ